MTVRDVDPHVFREFKADAVRKRLKLGTALTLAMEKFRADLREKKVKFTDWRPVRWGKGTKHVSEQTDEILYGE